MIDHPRKPVIELEPHVLILIKKKTVSTCFESKDHINGNEYGRQKRIHRHFGDTRWEELHLERKKRGFYSLYLSIC